MDRGEVTRPSASRRPDDGTGGLELAIAVSTIAALVIVSWVVDLLIGDSSSASARTTPSTEHGAVYCPECHDER